MNYIQRAEQQIALLKEKKDVVLLAIETSCDETGAAVIRNGRDVLSNVLYSQIDIHKEFGGVVPEIASRNHLEKLPYMVRGALEKAGLPLQEVDAIAVTQGPGLVGALLTGVSYAKGLAYATGKPLIPVNHMEGHISANYITHRELKPPFLCLIVSGGHTNIVMVNDYGNYTPMGATRDDAAGEAFDKVARVLGMEYPGGPNLSRLAEQGNDGKYALPKSFRGESHLDFSFSGIKTAVINMLHNMEQKGEIYEKADIAASFERAVTENLIENTLEAARRTGAKKIALAGGVSANQRLRKLAEERTAGKYELYLPDAALCTDNAAMIGAAAYYALKRGILGRMDLNADPSMTLIETGEVHGEKEAEE